MKIGRLVYDYKGKRSGNVGEGVFLDHLTHSVVDVGAEDALSCDVLLVSIPSTYQYVDYLKLARKHKFDTRKNTRIVVGGYGAINPFFLTDYYDYFVIGRVHTSANEIIYRALGGGLGELAYAVDAKDPVRSKMVSQDPLCESESFVGCPYRCKFCQYAHIRDRQGKRSGYIQETLTSGKSPELMLKDVAKLKEKPGRIRTAIDGYSERLRSTHGKRISNQDIVDAVQHLGSLAKGKKPVVVTLYNIANMPGETDDDYLEFVDMISSMPEPSGRVIIALYSTTFRPSPLTPLEYSAAGTFPSIVPMRLQTVRDTPNLMVKHAYSLEGPLSALNCVLIERCGLDDYEVIQDAVTRPRVGTLKSEEKARAVLDKFGLWDKIGKVDWLPTDFITKSYHSSF